MKEIKIKYVRAAGFWCLTYFSFGKQIQEWFNTREEAETEVRIKQMKEELEAL